LKSIYLCGKSKLKLRSKGQKGVIIGLSRWLGDTEQRINRESFSACNRNSWRCKPVFRPLRSLSYSAQVSFSLWCLFYYLCLL